MGAEDITLRSGEVIRNATITSHDHLSVSITTPNGIRRVALADLPTGLQSRYQFDPGRAAQIEARNKAAGQTAEQLADVERLLRPWTDKLAIMKRKSYERGSDHDLAVQKLEQSIRGMRAAAGLLEARGARDLARHLIDLVCSGKIAVGMPTTFVELAWGKPDAVHRTTTQFGTDEQWVYRRNPFKEDYVYFTAGLVTLIQN